MSGSQRLQRQDGFSKGQGGDSHFDTCVRTFGSAIAACSFLSSLLSALRVESSDLGALALVASSMVFAAFQRRSSL